MQLVAALFPRAKTRKQANAHQWETGLRRTIGSSELSPSAAHGWAWRMRQTKRSESEKNSLYNIAYMWNLKVIQRDVYTKQK